MKILLTGAAGFIGSYVVKALLQRGDEVLGLDSINDYYDVNIKFDRLSRAGISREAISYGKTTQSNLFSTYRFIQMNLEDKDGILDLLGREEPQVVCNLAAQAGVRYSLTNPFAYSKSNLEGFLNIIEASKRVQVGHFVYASSSSVYGLNEDMPFSVHDNVDHPVSLYAASKKANELMAHSYSHMFGLPCTGLRFFTVYGPWGRPDMALFLFTKAILEGTSIQVFNHGNMKRDFTYIDDIIEGIVRVLDKPATANPAWDPVNPDPGTSPAPYRIYNLGNGAPVLLNDFIHAIEEALGMTAKKILLPLQVGDVPATWADTLDLERDFDYRPKVSVKEGIGRFVAWYRDYYKV